MDVGNYIKELRNKKSISQRQLAELSGISNAEISRIETGERQKPSPDVLRKLAPHLEVPYESLMQSAGYINERSVIFAESREAEEKFISIIIPRLVIDGWSIESTKMRGISSDLIARKNNEELHFDFKYFRTRDDDNKNFRELSRAKEIAIRSYGRLTIYSATPITKYTMVVNDMKIFNYIKEFPPVNLNIRVTIMLINLDEMMIADEYEFPATSVK